MTNPKRSTEEEGPETKRLKEDFSSAFAKGLFDQATQDEMKETIAASEPYKHGVINELIDDELLRNVRKEIMNEIHFTKKETDIYKVHQTGDLANLSGLDSEELSRLGSLNRLRNALYSQKFREYLSYVSGSGPLSGIKKDLSVNVYQKGCHLLNHDDVIGSRRVSYILYLPDPDEPWDAKWGGALRLYPTLKPNIPETDWSLAIPPQWNQLAFFKVQPGLSFHDVEEVYVDKPRLSISGWFHIPQEGEEGYKEGEEEDVAALSSLKQLESRELREMDFPKRAYEQLEEVEGNDESKDIEYLSKYLNPNLLKEETLAKLNDVFVEESLVEIRDFLNKNYAAAVRQAIDVDDLAKVPTTSKEVPKPWDVARPPHKARYLYLDKESSNEVPVEKGSLEAHAKLQELRQLFKSAPFTRWLAKFTAMNPTGAYVLARRFRPGFDFTLATTHDASEPVLEATLGLTPTKGWEDGEVGGYDLAMTIDEDAKADPAVYRGATVDNPEEEDSPVLFNNPANWNVFSIIVRDQGILRFVKYVSKNARGSRWDISAEWTAEYLDDEDEE
ncbi:prolyl 3,4-dihydroxylase Tpa1p [Trichomonascus vanleenenianus]|uniref:oxidative DNA demethylase n=1 Tax=Trichomonascus vanleenenianus TaxID=2268995 RepID=UPI003ECAA7DA